MGDNAEAVARTRKLETVMLVVVVIVVVLKIISFGNGGVLRTYC